MRINLFIVDDHQLIVDGLVDMLDNEEEITVIGTASDGNEAIEKIPIVQPDLVLLDLDLPGKNGFEVLEHLNAKQKSFKCIILSMHLEKALLEKSIRLGVDGYLPKTVNKNELIDAIHRVSRGDKHFSAEVTMGLVTPEMPKQTITPLLISDLSIREKEVLKELAMGKTNKEVSESLNISVFTVETHRKNIMRKLSAHTAADLIRIAFKSGLVE